MERLESLWIGSHSLAVDPLHDPRLLALDLERRCSSVGGGALSWASATRVGACCRISGTDVGTTAVGARVSMSTRGGPTLSEAIRMTGLATSRWVIVSVSGK
jgi:hypothetical protein